MSLVPEGLAKAAERQSVALPQIRSTVARSRPDCPHSTALAFSRRKRGDATLPSQRHLYEVIVAGLTMRFLGRVSITGVFVLTAFALSNCYEPYPYYPPTAVKVSTPASFDASWQAARGAALDEGVRITYEDRASGTLRGDKGPFAIAINVASQPNGSVIVQFTATGPTEQDPTLKDRLNSAYQRRMGR